MANESETLRVSPKVVQAAGVLRLLVLQDDSWTTQLLPADGELVVGRGEDVQVRIDDRSMSRRHAKLVLGRQLFIEDLGSANGTRVGGRTLGPNERAPLFPGEPADLGNVTLVVQREVPSSDFEATAAAPVASEDPMARVRRLVERVAPSMINVLLLGESGVGKEVIAQELQRRSRRANAPYLRLNCAALTESLLESELFGHERGAFTGAVKTKPGLLETARGGTVLLDEVGELPPSIQAKLLRVLEERRVLRVGGLEPEPIDVRFLFATNRSLEEEVANGTFRTDLYYRLNGISIQVPPLRQRKGELPALVEHFLKEAAKREEMPQPPPLTPQAYDALLAHSWPGNIRELRNVIDRAVVLSGGEPISEEDLHLSTSAAGAPSSDPASQSLLKSERSEAEKRIILQALDECGGNQTRAAERLGISRRTLVNRLSEYGLTRKKSPQDD